MGQADNRLSVVEVTEASGSHKHEGIRPGKKITLHFSLALIDKINEQAREIVDSNFDKAPVTFTFGDGSLLPGFENAIMGLQAGDEKSISLNSENAFGLVNEDNIQGYPRYQFPADLVLEKGLMINFSDAAGNDQAGVVLSFDAEKVVVDFNHPLAGETIEFTVKIITLVDA